MNDLKVSFLMKNSLDLRWYNAFGFRTGAFGSNIRNRNALSKIRTLWLFWTFLLSKTTYASVWDVQSAQMTEIRMSDIRTIDCSDFGVVRLSDVWISALHCIWNSTHFIQSFLAPEEREYPKSVLVQMSCGCTSVLIRNGLDLRWYLKFKPP